MAQLTIGMACYQDFDGAYFSAEAIALYHPEAAKNIELVVVDNDPLPRNEHGQQLAVTDKLARVDLKSGQAVGLADGAWMPTPDSRQAFPRAIALADAKAGMPARVWDLEKAPSHTKHLVGYLGSLKVNGSCFADVRYIPFVSAIGTSAPRQAIFDNAKGDFVMCMDSHVMLWPGALRRLLDYLEANPDSNDLLAGPVAWDWLVTGASHFQDVWRGEMWGIWALAWFCECGHGLELLQSSGHVTYRDLWPPSDERHACPKCGKALPTLKWAGHENALKNHGFKSALEVDEPFEIPGMGLGLFCCRRGAWPGFNPKFRGFGGEEMYIHEKVRQAGGRNLCLPWLKWTHRFGRANGVKYPLTRWNKVRNYVIGHTEIGLPLDRVHEHFCVPQKLPDGREMKALVTEEGWAALTKDPANPPEQEPSGACGTCQKQAAMQDAAASKGKTLEQLYEHAAKTKSDINEHAPKLRELASKCDYVTEFGMRHGVSTVALLAGQPKKFVSIDLNKDPIADVLKTKQGKCAFEFRQGSSLEVDIEPTDLLFIDTVHRADHLYAELTKHADKVKKWIAFHDTEAPWGEQGEGGGPGTLAAIRRFVKERPEWSVIYHAANNHGMTVISRDPADKPTVPSTGRQAWNFVKAMGRVAAEKLKGHDVLVNEEVAGQRLDICAICPERNNDRCTKCGCFLVERPDGGPGKTLLATEACPLAKWHQETATPAKKAA